MSAMNDALLLVREFILVSTLPLRAHASDRKGQNGPTGVMNAVASTNMRVVVALRMRAPPSGEADGANDAAKIASSCILHSTDEQHSSC